MNEEVRLISMNENEAVIAEKVTTYKRAEIEHQLQVATAEMENSTRLIEESNAAVQQLEQQISLWKQRSEKATAEIEVSSYKVELYSALKEAFDRDYPLTPKGVEQPMQTVAEVAEPVAEETPVIPTQEVVEESKEKEIIEEVRAEEPVEVKKEEAQILGVKVTAGAAE